MAKGERDITQGQIEMLDRLGLPVEAINVQITAKQVEEIVDRVKAEVGQSRRPILTSEDLQFRHDF